MEVGGGADLAVRTRELVSESERVTGVQEASKLLSDAILEERNINAVLEGILSRRPQVERGLANLKDSLGLLGLMQKHAETIAGSTRQASALAEDVSRRVRELDASQSRVAGAMQRLDSIVDASACVDELQEAMKGQEYDKAAQCIQQFTSLYFAVNKKQQQDEPGAATTSGGHGGHGGGSVRGKGSILSAVDEPREGEDGQKSPAQQHALREQALTVRRCARELRQVVLEQFEKAAREGDHEQVKRFAGILGPIGLVESGLQAFTKYLIGLISSRATTEYDTLLAEISIPKNLESERRVNFNKALTNLYRDIAEAIEANTALITEAYGEEGCVDVVLSLHEEAEARAGAILRKFIEYRQLDKLNAMGAPPLASKSGDGGLHSGDGGGHSDQVKAFERTIDEIVILCVRSEEYNHCIKSVLEGAAEKGVEKAAATVAGLPGSPLNCVVRELNAYYTNLEDKYMARTIAMAVGLNECVEGALTSSIVEDVFFILQKCGRRGMATGNVQCVCSVLSNINNHLCNAFLSALRHDKSVYDSLVGAPSHDEMAALDSTSDTQKVAQAVNNFDVSAQYIKKLKADLDGFAFDVFESADSRNRVQSCLSDLMKTSTEFQRLSQSIMEQVAQKVVPLVLVEAVELLTQLSFNLSDSEYAALDADDPWVSDLLQRMEEHLGWLQSLLTSQNYESLTHAVLGMVAKRVEALLLQKRFNQLGGLLLEKDVRNIVSYTANLSQRTVRDKFARLSQMATLLNLESPGEVVDYWGENADSMMWRLTPFEVKRVLKLRVEFLAADVDELNL